MAILHNESVLDAPESKSSLLASLGRLLVLQDRERIDLSRMLHSEIAGGLVACTSISEMIRHELGGAEREGGALRLHADLDSALRTVLGVVRDMTESLFPPVLKVFGLHTALEQLTRTHAVNFPGSLILHIKGDEPRLDLARRLNLFRVLEGLLEHCSSGQEISWIEVTCETAADQIQIAIDHDGGPALWACLETDPDMIEVRARCCMIGTDLEIKSAGPSGNARINFVMPLQRKVSHTDDSFT